MEEIKPYLRKTVDHLTEYLNEHSLQQLASELDDLDQDYYKQVLKSLRRLEVFCEEAMETVHVLLKSNPFRKQAAEKTLYGIYHKCVLEFFSPKDDVWYEDSRAAYTGRNSIRFHRNPPQSIINLMKQLEPDFQQMRENLDYYETDYQTKIVTDQKREASS
nr:DUF3907 family protein [Salirhabdus salicampi]